MDFSWSREEQEFRQDIRDFLTAELPQGWNDTLVLDKESDEYIALAKGFTRKVGARGWLAAHWPSEYGGLGWSFWQYFSMSEMIQRLAQVGIQMMGLYGQLEFNAKWAPLKGKIERLSLTSVSGTIAGGTSEIQRNIIAERGLGLPR